MRNPFRLIRVRLTLWHVLSLALLLAAFSGGVYFALHSALQDNLESGIESRSDVLVRLIQVENGLPALPLQLPPAASNGDDSDDELEEELDDEQLILIFDSSGALLLDTSDPDEKIPSLSAEIQPVIAGSRRWLSVSGDDDTFRVLAVPINRDGITIGALAVGESDEDIGDTLESLTNIIRVAFPVTILLAAVVGLLLAHRALAPIDRITRTARQLSAKDLSQRLDLDLPDDELGRLARTFDEMLERLETAFQRQRQFTSDASHELRTPLTIIKGQIEVTLSRPRDAVAYREVLGAIGEQSDRMIDLVNSLLLLARADAGQIPIQRDPVDVAAAVEIAIDELRLLAEEHDVRLSFDGQAATITADLTLFHQVLFNLLHNAIRHTPAGGSVQVNWSLGRGSLRLEVHDTGLGIAPEQLPRIFDRFYRVDVARARNEGGAGIGLAICRWIVEAHGGSISAESEVGAGSTFVVILPTG
ncbi:MAG: heavy metal sensor histidine kinase [Chloroflexia bacterium]|nr:heavy metal sensor histidine kinase [Chloroflexia bacterium]